MVTTELITLQYLHIPLNVTVKSHERQTPVFHLSDSAANYKDTNVKRHCDQSLVKKQLTTILKLICPNVISDDKTN